MPARARCVWNNPITSLYQYSDWPEYSIPAMRVDTAQEYILVFRLV